MTETSPWQSPSTVEEWKAAVVAAIAASRPLYLDDGDHPMAFIGQTSGGSEADRRIVVDGNLEIVGRGKERTSITPSQDSDTERCDFTMFEIVSGGNLTIKNLSIVAPDITSLREIHGQDGLFTTTIVNCKDYGTKDTLIKFESMRVLGDASHWFDIGFTSGGGDGLARQRLLIDDCEFGYSSLAISMFGPDGNNREIVLSNSSIGPSGGPGGGYSGFSGHTLYVHPGIVVRADNCHFLQGQRYTLHYFSSGGRTPTMIPSAFTACTFEYSPDFLILDEGGNGGNRVNFSSCVFNSGSHHSFGTVNYSDCTFLNGVVYGGIHPVRLYGCRFTPQIQANAGIGSGKNVKVYDCEFENFSLLQQQQAGGLESWEFNHTTFDGCQIFLDNNVSGSSVSLYDCSVSTAKNPFGANFFQVTVSGANVKLERTTVNTGLPYSLTDGYGGSSVNLVGWGNTILPNSTKLAGNSGITVNADAFGTIGSNPTSPTNGSDLVSKTYVDSLVSGAVSLPTVRVTSTQVTDLVNGDAGNILMVDYPGNAYVKIPPGLSVSVERTIVIRHAGAGTVTILSDTEVVHSLNGKNGTAGQWSEVRLKRLSGSEWMLTGDLATGQPAPVFNPFSINWRAASWANDPAWVNPGDGGAVTSMRNGGALSGSLNSIGPSAPIFRSSVNAIGGRSAIEFDGQHNALSQMGLTTSPTTTLVWIGQWKSVGGGNLDRVIDLNSPTRTCLALGFGSVWAGYSGGANYGPAANTNGTAVRALFKEGVGNSRLCVGGGSTYSATLASSAGGTKFTIGGDSSLSTNNFAHVNMAFAGVFDGDVTSDPNWVQFKSWVLSYYGLVVA